MKDILDILLDENNKDDIILMDESGKTLTFEQVAVILYDNGNDKVLYVILKPIDKIDGMKEDEITIFYVDEDDNGNPFLRVEEDKSIAVSVFEKYRQLLKES